MGRKSTYHAFPLDWHETNVRNMKDGLERADRELADLQRRRDSLVADIEKREAQLAQARAEGVGLFDAEHYKLKPKKQTREEREAAIRARSAIERVAAEEGQAIPKSDRVIIGELLRAANVAMDADCPRFCLKTANLADGRGSVEFSFDANGKLLDISGEND